MDDDAQPTLFDPAPYRVTPDGPPPATGLPARQYKRMVGGFHPLSSVGTAKPIRLHPQAAPVGDRAADGLRCGGCRWRITVTHHNKRYPKCVYGDGVDLLDASALWWKAPRTSSGAGSDVSAWWPACVDHETADPQPEEVACPFCDEASWTLPANDADRAKAVEFAAAHVRFAHRDQPHNPRELVALLVVRAAG